MTKGSFNKCRSRDCGCFCGVPAVVFDRPDNETFAEMLGERFQEAGFLVIWFDKHGHHHEGFFTLRPSAPALILRCLSNDYKIRIVYTNDVFVTRVAKELGITIVPWSVFRNVKVPKLVRVYPPIPLEPP
ncbi:MAG: hypothetical protein RQ842_04770 [Vulcanisaeta sp.]|nr:hypothetical protein [Vulcanisaeta sp.]